MVKGITICPAHENVYLRQGNNPLIFNKYVVIYDNILLKYIATGGGIKMLFKTVYGPELQSIFEFISFYGAYEKEALYRFYVPISDGQPGKRTNMDDAIAFLLTAGVIEKDETGKFRNVEKETSFRLLLLRKLREIQLNKKESNNQLDPWYLKLVDEVFVRPDQRIVFSLHQHFNTLEIPEVMSEEKTNAWKRVLEFLGIGTRLFGGFLCIYALDLVEEIIEDWEEHQGSLQSFLEDEVTNYLPWQNQTGDIASALWLPLTELERQGLIKLEQRQDLPHRVYGGSRQVKWISKEGKR